VIVSVAGKPIGNVGELLTSVSALKPGVPVKFTLLRQRAQVEINVTPGLRPKPPPTER
jgi:S1-C subfamily serine protease